MFIVIITILKDMCIKFIEVISIWINVTQWRVNIIVVQFQWVKQTFWQRLNCFSINIHIVDLRDEDIITFNVVEWEYLTEAVTTVPRELI